MQQIVQPPDSEEEDNPIDQEKKLEDIRARVTLGNLQLLELTSKDCS